MNRDQTLDILKGIGIIMMVVAHSGAPDWLHDTIYTFHMPLFFIASGWFFSERNLDDCRGFAFRKMKAVYWPYLKWCVIFLLLHNVFYSVGILNGFYGSNGVVNHEYDIKEMATLAIDFTFRMTRYEGLLGAYWFVRSLLWGSLLLCFSSALMCRLTKLNKTTCVSSVAVIFGIMGGQFLFLIYTFHFGLKEVIVR
jgi:fucose 4-O-acetylase-like acetyltransferase